jgi:hypothetical protein
MGFAKSQAVGMIASENLGRHIDAYTLGRGWSLNTPPRATILKPSPGMPNSAQELCLKKVGKLRKVGGLI